MFNRKKKKELNELLKSEKKLKLQSGCKKRLPTTITILVLFMLFFGFQAYQLYGSINLKGDDLIYNINIDEKLEEPFSEINLNTAKSKLNEVGLTTLSNQYIVSNLENNVEIPISNLTLSTGEFASLLVPIYYAKYGKSTTIYELITTKSIYQSTDESNTNDNADTDEMYNIRVTSSFMINIKIYNIKINEPLYVTEFYTFNKTQNTLTLTNYELLNVNKNYIKKSDIEKSKTEDNFIQSFLSYVFLKEDNQKNYIQQLNYSNFNIDQTTKEIILS